MQRRLSSSEDDDEENEDEEEKQQSDEEERPAKKSKEKAKKAKNKSPRVRFANIVHTVYFRNILKPVNIYLIYLCNQRPKARPSINREVSNEFRPSPWITDVIPRKSPFVPQMGDEVCALDFRRHTLHSHEKTCFQLVLKIFVFNFLVGKYALNATQFFLDSSLTLLSVR